MKIKVLRTISETIEKVMHQKGISPKQLAEKSGIGYSSLMPILSGSRDFGVTKLVAIANALNCDIDVLLEGLLIPKKQNKDSTSIDKLPRYLTAFISLASTTYCLILDRQTNIKKSSILSITFGCGQNANEFIDNLVTSIEKLLSKNTKLTVNNKNIAVFMSVQQFEGVSNREKIQKIGDSLFNRFVIESDAISNHRALLKENNGICVTINNGNGITYSIDNGNNIIKLQGYGFPISDVAGNEWIGCEAIKHVVNVKENIEESSLLSDRILAFFNDDMYALTESIMTNPVHAYMVSSTAVRELIWEDKKAQDIVAKSADLLFNRLKLLDKELKIKLSIVLTGELASIYTSFFPKERFLMLKDKPIAILLNYGIEILQIK